MTVEPSKPKKVGGISRAEGILEGIKGVLEGMVEGIKRILGRNGRDGRDFLDKKGNQKMYCDSLVP